MMRLLSFDPYRHDAVLGRGCAIGSVRICSHSLLRGVQLGEMSEFDNSIVRPVEHSLVHFYPHAPCNKFWMLIELL